MHYVHAEDGLESSWPEHKVVQVEAIHADKVRVKVGGPDATGSHYNKYVVIKRAGRWIRDPFSELEDDRTFSGR